MNLLNSLVVSLIPLTPKLIVARFAKPYIAGENLSDAVSTVKELNSLQAMATVDVLGEDVFTRDEAVAAREEVKKVVNEIHAQKLDANISIKLTQLGLKIDKTFCQQNVDEIIALADSYNLFVRIDMEDHTCTDETLEVYRMVRKKFPKVGVVVQAYLKRSEDDVRVLVAEGANIRLCKGIYNEPAEIAFKDRREIQQNFVRLLKILMKGKCYVGIATHDDVLISSANRIIEDLNLTQDDYEYQMLLGVRAARRQELISSGHRMRVYTPFGMQWYGYSTRRLKENPQMAGYVFKSILGLEK
jgi:proline dehydrogenase